MINKNKKAQITFDMKGIPGIAVIIILAILVLSFGALILNTVAADQLKHGTGSVVNESDTATVNVNFNLNQNDIEVTTYVMTRGLVTVESGNFTLDAALGTVNLTNTSGLFLTGNTLEVNSSYDFETDVQNTEFNISKEGTVTIENISNLLPTSGTVIGAAIIITILLGAFAFGRFGLKL